MDGPSGDIVLRFELADHIPEDRLFRFISGVHFHADGDLVAVQQEPQPDNRILFVFLTGAFPSEIILPVDLKIKVGAVKIGPGSVQAEYLFCLDSKYLNELLVVIPDKG